MFKVQDQTNKQTIKTFNSKKSARAFCASMLKRSDRWSKVSPDTFKRFSHVAPSGAAQFDDIQIVPA